MRDDDFGRRISIQPARPSAGAMGLPTARNYSYRILFAIATGMSCYAAAAQSPQRPIEVSTAPGLQDAHSPENRSLARSADGDKVLPAESLGKDDLIEITVPYCPELSGKFRVGSDGKLELPLLRSPIPATGRTPRQVATLIREALTSEQIMADPSVNISVLEYRSRTVNILGAVLHPLTFQATGETTLLNAITMAGGLSPTAGSSVLVVSSQLTSQGTLEKTAKTISVEELMVKANPIYNLALHGGEEIRVVEAGKIFVAGNVVHPGMYTMQGDQDTTVLKALALSQGLQSYSTSSAYIYRRSAKGAERQEIEVPLSRIIARKERDITLISDDILYIPEAKGRRMTSRVLNQITGFGQTAAAGILIYK